MRYVDAIYGTVEIAEPALLDLMKTDAVGRLKGVSQHGITSHLGITPPFSRFEHSVGAMLLVRQLGASIDEQIVALLHDISHTAFSHVIDFVFDDHSGQRYHEETKEAFVASSDIPAIMDRHGMDWREYLDETRFPLLEQPSPALCADRLDYFLRDLELLNLADGDEIQAAVASLVVKEGKIVVNNLDAARWLAYTFIETDRASWSSFREVGLYQLTAEAIKAALDLELIGEADLWGSDADLWGKLSSARHPEVQRLLHLVTPGTRFVWDEERPEFTVSTKVRSIDPAVADGTSVLPLSELDPAFERYRKGYIASKQRRWPMGVVGAPWTQS
ncbi:MAG: HD domain-containing protein [Gammaproteobacteria bacterium]|nr:HD domain-containing protein [Gammaproteobacteria bacterium]NIT63393.1 HD domain-containing protein [Gammaproteobacteria bacterium]NIX10200.1 HD domain-containing protein [Gammaproteobacteria bacterium]NIY31973.1 HD domain-containing protein [Gammaproteobacteria bacterium]